VYGYWSRPGKDPREGHSATVNSNGRLFVFTSNAHPVPPSPDRTTYDAVDVLGCYLLGHFPSQSERVEVLRSFAGLSGQPRTAPLPPLSDGWLSDDFWESRQYLSAIRQAVWAAQRCPEAFLGAVLSTYSVHPVVDPPGSPGRGQRIPTNTFVAMVGQTGRANRGDRVSRRSAG
jgi:hypothetical protein